MAENQTDQSDAAQAWAREIRQAAEERASRGEHTHEALEAEIAKALDEQHDKTAAARDEVGKLNHRLLDVRAELDTLRGARGDILGRNVSVHDGRGGLWTLTVREAVAAWAQQKRRDERSEEIRSVTDSLIEGFRRQEEKAFSYGKPLTSDAGIRIPIADSAEERRDPMGPAPDECREGTCGCNQKPRPEPWEDRFAALVAERDNLRHRRDELLASNNRELQRRRAAEVLAAERLELLQREVQIAERYLAARDDWESACQAHSERANDAEAKAARYLGALNACRDHSSEVDRIVDLALA